MDNRTWISYIPLTREKCNCCDFRSNLSYHAQMAVFVRSITLHQPREERNSSKLREGPVEPGENFTPHPPKAGIERHAGNEDCRFTYSLLKINEKSEGTKARRIKELPQKH